MGAFITILIWFQPFSAYAANLEFTVTRDTTGGISGPLNTIGDDFCPSSSTPGCDTSATNDRLRTNDIVTYEFAAQVDPPGDTVSIEAVLKPGLYWESLPALCDQFTSTITGDGTASSPSSIICELGFRSSWASNILFSAKARHDIQNGTNTGLRTAVLKGDNSTDNGVNLSATDNITITASPRLNIRLRNHSTLPLTVGGVAGMRSGYSVWVELWDHDRNSNSADDKDPFIGHEYINQNLTYTVDLSAVSPNSYIYACYGATSSASIPLSPFNATLPERSVLDSGSTSCSGTGPSATGSVTVTISGADLALNHFPLYNRIGGALPADRRVAANSFVYVFTPLTDITDAGGSLSIQTQLTNFNPQSISSQANYLGVGETLSDNSTSVSLQSYPGSFSHALRCYMTGLPAPSWCPTLWWGPPTNATAVSAGNGSVEPEQTFASYTYYRNRALSPETNAEVCTVLDSRYIETLPHSPGKISRCHGSCGTEDTDYAIEYGVGYVSNAWQDAATTPARAVADECQIPEAEWYSDYNTAIASGEVTKIRMRRLTPLVAGGTHAMSTQMRVKPNAQLSGVTNGTLMKTWGSMKADTTFPAYRDCDYTQGAYPTPGHTTDACGDRMYLVRAEQRISKITLPNDNVNTIVAGGQTQFELRPSYSTESGTGSDTITIVDELPAGSEYVPNSAMQNSAAFPPSVTGNVSTGQTLTWNLGTVNANSIIAPIAYAITTPTYTPSGTELENTARIDGTEDISPASRRSDTRKIIVVAPATLLMDKIVDAGTIAKDGTMTFTVSYSNDTSTTINVVDTIDILPFPSDGRFPESSFSGTTQLGAITAQSSNILGYVSADDPSTIDNDPKDASNDLVSGSVNWCPLTASFTVNPSAAASNGGGGTCPSNAANVTALRMVDQDPLTAGLSRNFTFELATQGNVGDDVYTNQAQGAGDNVSLSPLSPFVTINVLGVGKLEAEKVVALYDPAGAGLYAIPGNDVIYTITIQNVGDGPIDSDSMYLIDNFPAELEFWNGDIDAGGPDSFPGPYPVGFLQVVGTGISFDASTDLRFSTASTAPASFSNCTQIPADNSYRDDINYVCINPKGILDHGDPRPIITLSLRGKIK